MTYHAPSLSKTAWILALLGSSVARAGGIIIQDRAHIDRVVGRDLFLKEMHKNGFRVVENADHIIIFCNSAPIRRVL